MSNWFVPARKPERVHRHRAKDGPLHMLWRPGTIAWMLATGEGVAVVLALAPGVAASRLHYFLFLSVAIQWVLVCTLACLYALRGWLQHFEPRHIALVAVGLLFGCAWTLTAITGVFLREISVVTANSWGGQPWRAAAIALAVGLLGLAIFQTHWRYRQSLLRAKQAELEALQARIHPHFLFNTLNSAAALVHARPDDAEQVLLDLGDLFRAALSEPGWVPLEHEMDLCRRYLAIEQQRFGDRLRVEWQVEGLQGLSVPLLTVQPLVENAVAHGLDEHSGVKSIRVEAVQTAEELVVSVRNAVPRDRAAAGRSGHSVGLAGVRARIESVTQGTGSVATESDGTSFVVHVALPKTAMPTQDRTGAQ